MAAPQNERWPPRKAAKVVFITFDFATRKADYRSFVEMYQERLETMTRRRVKIWAYYYAGKCLLGMVPSEVRGPIIAALLKLIIR